MANTLYYVVYDSALAAPSNTQIAAGNDVNGDPAVDSGSVATSVTATINVSGSGLTADTSYRVAYWHDDADPADVEVSAAFVTAAAITGTAGDFNAEMKKYMDVLTYEQEHVDHQVFEYLASLGYAGDLPYKMYQCLLGKGVAAGSLQGMLREYLTSLGYTSGDLYTDFRACVIANEFCSEGIIVPPEEQPG